MKIREFAAMLCAREKGKQEVNIAQMMEILKCLRAMLKDGLKMDLYTLIHRI